MQTGWQRVRYFGRQLLIESGTQAEQVRIYHCRIRLGPLELPVIQGALSEVAGLLFLEQQSRLNRQVAAREQAFADKVILGIPLASDEAQEHPLVSLVESLPGVTFVRAWGYSMIVVKGQMFEWDEIEPSVLRAMKTFSVGLPEEDYTWESAK
jgi:hypothetical protein